MLQVIKDAAEKAGGLSKLAASLGVRHQTFYSWSRVPAERAVDIERLTGIPRHELRPDLWPLPAQVPEPEPSA